jgi:26S proteasome regulatory subunit N9
MASKVIDFLEQLQQDHAAIAADVSELAALYQKKLWHQLTVRLDECFAKAEFNQGNIPERVYEHFISDFGHKINLLKLAHFAVHVSKHLPSKERALAFLQQVQAKLREHKLPRSAEPLLFLQMHVGQAQLELGQLQDAKATVEQGHDELASLPSVDPSVSAAVFYVKSLYHKLKKEYTEFYRSSLMYLSFVSSDALTYEFKLALAVDVSLAALLGEHLYNFAQLLMHPVVHVLDGSPYQWLHEMLECFHKGDLFKYDELCAKHAAVLNGQPALVESERMLRQKVTISCLINLISSLPPEERTIPLQVGPGGASRGGEQGGREGGGGCRRSCLLLGGRHASRPAGPGSVLPAAGRRCWPASAAWSRSLQRHPSLPEASAGTLVAGSLAAAAACRPPSTWPDRRPAPLRPAQPSTHTYTRASSSSIPAGHCGAHQADGGRRGVPADEGAGAAPHRGPHRPGGGHGAGGQRVAAEGAGGRGTAGCQPASWQRTQGARWAARAGPALALRSSNAGPVLAAARGAPCASRSPPPRVARADPLARCQPASAAAACR